MLVSEYILGNPEVKDILLYSGEGKAIYYDFKKGLAQKERLESIEAGQLEERVNENQLFQRPRHVLEVAQDKNISEILSKILNTKNIQFLIYTGKLKERLDTSLEKIVKEKCTILEERIPTKSNTEGYVKSWLKVNELESPECYNVFLRNMLDYVVLSNPSIQDLWKAIEYSYITCVQGENFQSIEWMKYTNKSKEFPVFAHKVLFEHLSQPTVKTKTEIIKLLEVLEFVKNWDKKRIVDHVYGCLQDLYAVNKNIGGKPNSMEQAKYTQLQKYSNLDLIKVVKYLILVARIEVEFINKNMGLVIQENF